MRRPGQERHLDGNAAAGQLSTIFGVDVTAAEGQCAHCGAIDRFASVHLYVGPGLVARCPSCEHVLLRLVAAGEQILLDLRGLKYLRFHGSQLQESGG